MRSKNALLRKNLDEEELLQKALARCYFFLKFRPRTKKEVSDYLKKLAEKLHFSEDVEKKAVLRLEELGYLNDEEFIGWFVRARGLLKPKSQRMLTLELKKHGVSREDVDAFFEFKPIDEQALSTKALIKRWARWKSLSPKERFEKASSFLARRGFSWDTIKSTIKHLEDVV